jgi:hypothetical protein
VYQFSNLLMELCTFAGIEYLHSKKGSKPPVVHQNISADKILLDHHLAPRLSVPGLHKLLADDVVFSALKASAAMGLQRRPSPARRPTSRSRPGARACGPTRRCPARGIRPWSGRWRTTRPGPPDSATHTREPVMLLLWSGTSSKR